MFHEIKPNMSALPRQPPWPMPGGKAKIKPAAGRSCSRRAPPRAGRAPRRCAQSGPPRHRAPPWTPPPPASRHSVRYRNLIRHINFPSTNTEAKGVRMLLVDGRCCTTRCGMTSTQMGARQIDAEHACRAVQHASQQCDPVLKQGPGGLMHLVLRVGVGPRGQQVGHGLSVPSLRSLVQRGAPVRQHRLRQIKHPKNSSFF